MGYLFEQCQVSGHNVAMATKTAIKSVKKAPRTSYHHGNLQAELSAGAIKIVRNQGPENFSLRSLATAIGVSPSAVYHYFPDKDSLITNLCDQLFAEMAQMQADAIAMIPGKSAKAARARFRAIGRVYFEWAAREPHLFRMMFSGHSHRSGEASRSPESNDAYITLQSSLDELLNLGQLNPKVRPYGELIAWSAVHGAASLILEGALAEESFEALLDGLETALFVAKR